MKKADSRYRICGAGKNGLPALAGRNALREASADDLRVLLCLAELGEAAAPEALSDAVGCSVGRVMASLEYWCGCGVLEETPEETARVLRPAAELSEQTGEETEEIIRRRDLGSLIDEAQRLYGKLFNASEIGVIAGLSEQLEMEDAYILTLLSWCVNRGKKSLRYAEKTAFSLYEEGVESIGALEEHIQRRERAASGIGQLRRMFGIGERALTKREDGCFNRWLGEYAYPVDVVGIAYDMTVNATGKASVAYADKIVTKWYTAGCRSEGDVEALIERERKNLPSPVKKPATESSGGSVGSFDTDEFFARALERSYGTKKGG